MDKSVDKGCIHRGSSEDAKRALELAAAWRTHFIPESLSLIYADAVNHHLLVYELGSEIRSFLVYQVNSCEIEFLWLATDSAFTRRGIASWLVNSALATATTQKIVLAKTATTDSAIANSYFRGDLYESTHAFFVKNGFCQVARLERYWGPRNHCLVFSRSIA